MPITRLTRLELEGIYEADTVLRLLNGSQWVLPEKLPVPTGTTVNVHLEVVVPESEPLMSADNESESWYEQAAALRQAICQRRGEAAGDSVEDLHVVREARAERER